MFSNDLKIKILELNAPISVFRLFSPGVLDDKAYLIYQNSYSDEYMEYNLQNHGFLWRTYEDTLDDSGWALVNTTYEPIYLFLTSASLYYNEDVLGVGVEEVHDLNLQVLKKFTSLPTSYVVLKEVDDKYSFVEMTQEELEESSYCATGVFVTLPPLNSTFEDVEEVIEEVPPEFRLLLSNANTDVNQSGSSNTSEIEVEGNSHTPLQNKDDFDMCLTKRKATIEQSESFKTDCIDLTGRFAIEINGKVVPYSFTADQLPKFFNGKNNSDLLIQLCTTPCISTPDFYIENPWDEFPFSNWKIDYTVNGGPLETYTNTYEDGLYRAYLVSDVLYDAADKYGFTVSSESSANFFISSNYIEVGHDDSATESYTVIVSRNSEDEDNIFGQIFNTDQDYIEFSSCGIVMKRLELELS